MQKAAPSFYKSTSSCPVCMHHVVCSELVEHVNNCLDASTSLPIPDEIPSPPPSPSAPSSNAGPSHQSTPSPDNQKCTSVASWLSDLGLPKYATGFLRAGYRTLADLVSITHPSDQILRSECGVTALGARKKICSELSALRNRASEPSSEELDQIPTKDEPKKRIWAIFEPGYRASDSPRKRPRTGAFSAPAPVTPATNAPASGQGQRKPRTPSKHFFSHRVPDTDLTVDSFYAARGDPPGSIFFLSHFHSDHYGPLRKTTLPRGGRVMCSAVTASLVHSMLRVPKESLQVLPMAKKVDLKGPGVSVWLYDANHCPGAVVFLFHVWRTGRYVLHSGDCRFDPKVFDRHEKIVEVVKKGMLDYLYLDTTYCNPKYAFPYQAFVLEQVVAAALEENRRTKGRCLYFFGTYSIGKERVFLAVAEALNLRIYAGKRKRHILEQCGFGKRLNDRLVKNAGEARIQVVSMRALSADGLRTYAEMNKLNNSFIGRGLAIVFRPTGWTFRGNTVESRRVNRAADQAMLYEVPYSEHSSYEELVAFVKWSKPTRVIPTVNARSAEQADQLRKLLGHVDKRLRPVT